MRSLARLALFGANMALSPYAYNLLDSRPDLVDDSFT